MQNNIENSEMDRASVLARAILSERHFFLAIHEGIRAIHIDDAIILAKAIERQRQDLERIATTKFEGPPSLDPVVILQEIAREALSEGDSK